MDDLKVTPGEWTADIDGHDIVAEDGELIATFYPMRMEDQAGQYVEGAANLRMCAAAKKLYDACVAMRRTMYSPDSKESRMADAALAAARGEVATEELFYVMSPYGPCGNSASWWAVNGHGYTSNLSEAWRVSKEKALDIVGMKRGDRAFLTSEVDSLTQRHFDIQKLRQVQELKS